ncbi:MAG: ABC transporter substrate-binding protein [Gammaproteobacteria bacterium]|nr:ABC transporter substrate-binding protein [Gammaproteobacteria bacterium]MBT4606128.1 ABC transporter substrate-binding protein [Thiotrichales bacterium]MBT3968502.1 ABC transporter substrate-binding protein [Gammaproteobacteria bacterium]MBT4081241.1 ABC transporter substrate-binding protein [Gammaproteobacteria bacterium]MBT4329190.1 ABC transporter substrate-binding protein [Gammaproteobacteria bacterium]
MNIQLRWFLLLGGVMFHLQGVAAGSGVTPEKIHLGSVLALKGKAQGLGQSMRYGLNAALNGQQVGKRTVEIHYRNDSYEPSKTVPAVQKLIRQQQGIFLMVGNVGTPTAKVTLPMLKQERIPAVGFFTGADILRPGKGDVINYRASYLQETAAVIRQAIEQGGISTGQVCAYVQNDGYGMAGLQGVVAALGQMGAQKQQLGALSQVLRKKGVNPARNYIGPVGVYRRNTRNVLNGYKSLKHWEEKSGYTCKMVVTVGAYDNIVHFVEQARKSGESWLVSAVSFTGADHLHRQLKKKGLLKRVIMTQVVPLPEEKLPVIEAAKRALGSEFGLVSLEGYLVGKMVLNALQKMESPPSRYHFLNAIRSSQYDLGGVEIDFTRNGYQGSDLVVTTVAGAKGFLRLAAADWKPLLSD